MYTVGVLGRQPGPHVFHIVLKLIRVSLFVGSEMESKKPQPKQQIHKPILFFGSDSGLQQAIVNLPERECGL